MRLIDADKLHYTIDINAYRHTYIDQIHAIIDDAPTIDAVPQEQYDKMCHCNVQLGALIADLKNRVEVVRCKDCKWYGHLGCAIRIVDDSDKPSDNDYCSFGERSEE